MGSSEALVVNEEGLDLTVASINTFLENGDRDGMCSGGGGWVGETVVDVEAKERTKQKRKHDRERRRRGCRRTRVHCKTASQPLLRSRAASAANVIIMTLYVGDLDPEVDESGFDSLPIFSLLVFWNFCLWYKKFETSSIVI
ncbi:hypothetical protein AHAS_Ahas03G0114400 [Arachis hypogaea]